MRSGDIMNAGTRLLGSERGDVLMEYVVLTAFVIMPLTVYGRVLFNPAGAPSGDLGYFGEQFTGWMQRMIGGISLPMP